MKDKIFSLRIDIDSLVGLEKGVPNVLDVLKKYDIKASFYITFGREGNLFEVLKYKILRKAYKMGNKQKFPNSRLKSIVNRRSEILRLLLCPRKISSMKNLLRRIKEEGHNVGLHSYIHVKWRAIKEKEIKREFERMIKSFKDVFQTKPMSFASPYFTNNKLILDYTDKYQLRYASCLDGVYPFLPNHYHHIEIPVNTKMTSSGLPLIEYFARLGYNDKKILAESINIIEENMRKFGLVTTYIHPRIEGYYFIGIFNKLIKYVKEKGYEVKTYEETGDIFCNSKFKHENKRDINPRR